MGGRHTGAHRQRSVLSGAARQAWGAQGAVSTALWVLMDMHGPDTNHRPPHRPARQAAPQDPPRN
ncbi:hypothetical protein Cma02nite_07000 [Cellulomonas marina]|nr:hypothetical protein Cma02nite_07000 [Cellulomonas marina]